MPTRIHLGPDFEDFTMTSENFRWLHSCRWEAPHSEAFVRLRTRIPHSLAKAPNLVKSKTFYSPLTSAQWILVDEKEEPLAWAELQTFPSKHDNYGILLWGLDKDLKAFSEEHLTRLVSFCFVVGKFDHMKIAAIEKEGQSVIASIGAKAGELRRTMAFKPNAWHPSLSEAVVEMQSLEVAREEWEASSASDRADKTLEMVSARIARFEKAQAMMAPKRKRRSLLARLFRPKVDDSFF